MGFVRLLLLAALIPSGTSLAFDLEYLAKGSKPFMSSNGRYVAFVGSNLIAPSGEVNQVYLYDRDLDTLELISVATVGGGSANADVRLPGNVGQRAVSEDGRYVVFQTRATNLGFSDPGANGHIYLRDRTLATTTLVDKNTTPTDPNFGQPGNAGTFSQDFSIAPGGEAVVYRSGASNLHPGDTDNTIDTFRNVAGDNHLACADSSDAKLSDCREVSLASNGIITFISGSDDVVDPDPNPGGADVFWGVAGIGTGPNELISIGIGGKTADSNFFSTPSIDGREVGIFRIAFATKANLADADTDDDWDLYVYDFGGTRTQLIRAPGNVSLRPQEVTMSANGTWIAFQTKAALVANDDNGTFVDDVYSIFYSQNRLELGTPQLASQEDGEVGNFTSVFPTVGDNGEVGFQSSSSNFGPLDGQTNVYVKGCTPSTLALDSDPVTDTESFEACEITAGSKEVQGPSGDLTLRAFRVIFESGFSVEVDALLSVEGF